MRKNRLRELLKAGSPSLGTHVLSSWPGIIELAGHAGGLDYIEFVSEYAPYDLYSFDNMARAVELFDHMTALVKIDQEPRGYLASKALNAGLQNILFADVRTVEDARECVAAVRAETPLTGGRHGAGNFRNVGYVLEGASAAYVQAMEDAVVMLMIEKKEAVENVEDILSVKGVDMVQFGPGDYSMSIGHPGEYNHPEVWEAYKHTVKIAFKLGVQPRAEIGRVEDAKRYLDLGIKHFSIGSDIRVLFNFWKESAAGLRAAIAKA